MLRRCGLRTLLRTRLPAMLRRLLLRWQGDSSVRIFVDFAALFHFSREFYKRAAAGVAQAERRGDFAKALRLAGTGQMRQDIGFGNRRARLIMTRHGPDHCMRSVRKTRSGEGNFGGAPLRN
jgi:hypothetical protein